MRILPLGKSGLLFVTFVLLVSRIYATYQCDIDEEFL